MYTNLKVSLKHQTIEGIILQEFTYDGKLLCITAYDPQSKKYSIGGTYDKPFKELKNFAELEGIISKMDRSLSEEGAGKV